jgi:hypothetical protein
LLRRGQLVGLRTSPLALRVSPLTPPMAVTAKPVERSFPLVARRPLLAHGWLTLSLLAAVLVLALGLRLSGLSWSLPWAFHPDEIFYVDQAQDMLKFGDPNPKYFRNPSLPTYLLAGELLATRALGDAAGPLADTTISAHLLARLNSALIGSASVVIVFAIGASLFNRWVGMVAALLLAVSFLHVRDSHYGVNDVPATGLLLVSVYAAARVMREPRFRWYLLAGLSGGLAASTKYNMGFFFVPLVVAHLLRGERATRPRTRSPALALAAVAGLVGYLAATPYTVLDARRFWEDFLVQYRFGDSRWLGQPLEPVPLLYLTTLLQGFGAVPLALALVGLLLACRQQLRAAAVLLAFPMAYLLFLLPKALFFPRFALPLLPFCSLLAAYAASKLVGRLQPEWRLIGIATLLTAAIAQPLANDLLHNRLLLEKDTRVLANEWIQGNLPPGSRLKIEDYSLRDSSTHSRMHIPNTAGLRIERFEGSPEADNARYFAERSVQYVVTSSFAYERYLLEPPSPSQQEAAQRYQRLHRSLDQRADLVVQFSPGRNGQEVPYRLEDMMTPFWSLEQYERPGPTVRIYSLTPLLAAPAALR